MSEYERVLVDWMTNPKAGAILHHYNQLLQSFSWTPILLLLFLLFLFRGPTIQAAAHPATTEHQWQILTKLNFSSQIRLHPDILLIVTVPWCGESRSLMKEVANLISKKNETFVSPKLMFVYRNNERILADSLGATGGITVLFYHHSLPYKYQGRLRAQNILSSAQYMISLLPEEIPLKSLNTPGDVKSFLESTDKTLLLLEFCGWTPRLLAKSKHNASESIFGSSGGLNETLDLEGKIYQKGSVGEKLNCGINDGFGIISSLNEYTNVNKSDPSNVENGRSTDEVSCSFEEFRRFEAIFSGFLTVIREFFLPPERLKFGIVAEKSMLSSLGVQDTSSSWSTMIYFAGCPNCSKVLKETDDLKSALQMHASPVTELKGNERDVEAALPDSKPSVLLFIHRSSDSSEIRRKSKEALDAFRELALHNQLTGEVNAVNTNEAYKTSCQSRHPKTGLSSIALKDTMSITIMNDGKHVSIDKVASDLQGKSLNEILNYVLHHKNAIKLSSLAKDAGFQLLSDDFDIKVPEAVPLLTENTVSVDLPLEDLEGNCDAKKDEIPNLDGTYNVEKTHDDTISHLNAVLDSHFEKETVQTKTSLIENGEEQLNHKSFRGYFFFSDSNFRLLKALTSVEETPALVILDPISQQHYVLPEEADFSYSELSDFLNRFINNTLLPYQLSEYSVPNTRKAPTPPFVNLDFRTADSFPRVTARTFYDLVIGNQSESANDENVWKKDVLVLFSTSSCGFCQRMELVVREVYRAFKGYANSLTRNKISLLSGDDIKSAILKLPLIYLMDCTMNDCSLILNSRIQRELYPSLLLFPAERKNVVSYGGDMAVSEVIKFIADHGSTFHWIVGKNGVLWTHAEQGTKNSNLNKDEPKLVTSESTQPKENMNEFLLKDRKPKPEMTSNQIRVYKQIGSQEVSLQVAVGTVIIATNKLSFVSPFDKSEILIVKANKTIGFQGLIINKPIRWDTLQELEEGLEILKEAPLYFGGPVMIRELPLVALTRKFIEDQDLEILPGIYFLDQRNTANVLQGLKGEVNQSVSDYWFFLGFSNWGWDQLFDEIAQGAWEVSNRITQELHWPGS